MKLPAADRAVVDPKKVRDYLLSSEHPVGRAKAHFFRGLGFTQARWAALQEALLALGRTGDAEPGDESSFGRKYVVRGTLQGPDGGAETITVWIVPHGGAAPRLVTAYSGASG